MKILVTGGAGYIGSHTIVELLNNNHEVVIVDNYSNSKPEVLKRIKKITNKDFKFYEMDVCDEEKLAEVFTNEKIDAVMYSAGLKKVGQSVAKPLKYYYNNILSTLD
jgi:UDP-glucose 4-epimerase